MRTARRPITLTAMVALAAGCATAPAPKQTPVAPVALATSIANAPVPPADSQPPRPQVVRPPQTRPAIFTENRLATHNIGPVAIDAKWSIYGDYLHGLIGAVQVQWEKLLAGNVPPPSGGTVTVKFIIDSTGRISRIVNVESKSTEQAAHACVSAITDRSPDGPWTDDMKAMLGEQQEMTFTFYYQ